MQIRLDTHCSVMPLKVLKVTQFFLKNVYVVDFQVGIIFLLNGRFYFVLLYNPPSVDMLKPVFDTCSVSWATRVCDDKLH